MSIVGLIPWIICGVLIIALCVAIYGIVRLARLVFDVEDALSESLDIIDKSYAEISTVLDTPVMFDSPEVRTVLFQIKRVRDAVFYISNVLAAPYGGIIEEEVEEEEPE